ncbi:MAG: efflux RND transporter permease subunit [Pseudohongiellaceae bacterium]
MPFSSGTKFVHNLTHRRGRWCAAALLLILVLSGGLFRTGFNASLGALLTRSDPYLAELDILNAEFPTNLEINFAFIPPPGQSVFSPTVLAAIAQLGAEYDAIPFALRHSSLLNYFSPERQQQLFTQAYTAYDAAGLNNLQTQASSDRLLTRNLLAADGSLTFGVVIVDDDGLSEQQRLAVADAALTLRDQLRDAHPAVGIHINSEVILEQSGRQAMVDDLSLLLPIVILICVATMGYCFRSVALAGCILLYMLATLIATLGTVGYMGVALNSISIIAPLVVMIIAVANSVHIVSIYGQARYGQESSPDNPPNNVHAIQVSLRENFQPITLAALTTAIGFSSLNMSSSPAIQDFGRIAAIGIGFAYLLSLTLLPTLLARFSQSTHRVFIPPSAPSSAPSSPSSSIPPSASSVVSSPAPPSRADTTSFLHSALARLDSFVRRQDRKLFWGYTALALITLALLPLNQTDFNRLDFIAADSDLHDYYEVVSERTNRGYTLTYAIDTGRVDGAIEPRFLEAVTSFLDELDGVLSAASIVDVIKTVNRFQHQNDPAYYTLPEDINTIGFYLNSYELVQSDNFPLSAFINDDFSIITLFLNVPPVSNQQLLNLDEHITTLFNSRFAAQLADQSANATASQPAEPLANAATDQPTEPFADARLIHGSSLLLFSRMDELVTIELLQGYSLSLLLITISLMVGLRSVYFGVLSVVPNLLPATMVFGVWALLVGQLDPFVMMLFSISIGLVVDDTVHILSHYLRARNRGDIPQDAVSHAIKTAGPALTITTLILVLGTTLLISANTIYFQQAAKLLVPIVALALVLDLTYLPGILKRFDRRATDGGTQA